MIETSERNEKLYRMLMTAYNDDGSDFWGIIVELALTNHWGDGTFAPTSDEARAEAALLETIPEAQELMRELLRRGLIYVARVYGYPPPSRGRSAVTEAEAETIINDIQSWIGPQDEDPSAIYYRFCSTIPGETITRDSVHLPGF